MVTGARRNGDRESRVDKMGRVAGGGAFRADDSGGHGFGAGSAIIPAAGSVLGGGYNPGDHTVVARCGAYCFLAAIRRNDAWSGSWRTCGESLPAARSRVRCLRVRPGAAMRRGPFESKRISLRGRYAGDCAVGAAGGFPLANRFSPVCGSVHRNWGGPAFGVALAGGGCHTSAERLNFFPNWELHCGYCLMDVTCSPVNLTKTVLSGGCP